MTCVGVTMALEVGAFNLTVYFGLMIFVAVYNYVGAKNLSSELIHHICLGLDKNTAVSSARMIVL